MQWLIVNCPCQCCRERAFASAEGLFGPAVAAPANQAWLVCRADPASDCRSRQKNAPRYRVRSRDHDWFLAVLLELTATTPLVGDCRRQRVRERAARHQRPYRRMFLGHVRMAK